jgi:hypothetical protein
LIEISDFFEMGKGGTKSCIKLVLERAEDETEGEK